MGDSMDQFSERSDIRGGELREECGIFGIAVGEGETRSAVNSTYNALFALQHRGQESAGMAVNIEGALYLYKASGLVPEVFPAERLEAFQAARSAIGHVRCTSDDGNGSPSFLNAQPLMVRHASGTMALCFNGRLSNSASLRSEMENHGAIFQTANDAETISHMIVREHLRTNSTEDAILNAMHYMVGAYSVVVLTARKLIAARDPNGFRPLCIGKVAGSYMFASESCAIYALGGTLIRDVDPGEVVVVEDGKLKSYPSGIHARTALCMFEVLYFARQDSILDGLSMDAARRRAGACLARKSRTEADIVIGVPDSGLTAAMGFAEESGIPYAMGFTKNRYIARTFIQPDDGDRINALRIKLTAISPVIKDKRVVVVDDSIVRGSTCRRTIQLLRQAGAREVHMKVSAPPFLNPCFFGTYIPEQECLAAHGRTVDEICALIGADTLQYQDPEDLKTVTQGLKLGCCTACFTGEYVVPVPPARAARPDRPLRRSPKDASQNIQEVPQ